MRRPANPMTIAANFRSRHPLAELPAHSIEARVRAFLEGQTNGEDVLHALYDHVLDEAIPYAMRRLLKLS